MSNSANLRLKKLAKQVLGPRIRDLRNVQLSARKLKQLMLTPLPRFSLLNRQFKAFAKNVKLLQSSAVIPGITLSKRQEAVPMLRHRLPTSVGSCHIDFEKLRTFSYEAEFVVTADQVQVVTGEYALTGGHSIAIASKEGDLLEELSFDIFGASNHKALSSLYFGEITEMPGKWCIILEPQAPTYAHWLIEFIPRLLWALELLGDRISEYKWFISGSRLPHQVWVLQQTGISEDKVVWCQGPNYLRFEHAIIPSFTSRGCLNVSAKSIDRIRRSLLPISISTSPPRKIYISRKDETFRRVTNEDAVIEAMQSRGFLIIHPREHSLEDKVKIFSQASLVVGCLSSGMSHSIFMPKGAKVLEVIPKNNPSPSDWAIMDAAELAYFVIHDAGGQESSGETGSRNRYSDVTIDIDLLIRAIDVAESS